MTTATITVAPTHIMVHKPGSTFCIGRKGTGKFWLATLIRAGWNAGKSTEDVLAYWKIAKRFA